MKIILLQDIRGLGKKWDLKEVSDGYARNFLITKNLALLATPKNFAQRDVFIKKQKAALEAIKLEAQTLSQETIEIKIKSGEKGEVFGSVTKEDVKKELLKKGYKDFDVNLEKPIRNLGEQKVEISFAHGTKASVRVNVH